MPITCRSDSGGSSDRCSDCRYYLDIYYPRIQFIEQIDKPAIIVKDLYLWGANRKTSELWDLHPRDAVGIGSERLVHQESLEKVIRNHKRRVLDPYGVAGHYSIHINGKNNTRIKCHVSITPLNQPMNMMNHPI